MKKYLFALTFVLTFFLTGSSRVWEESREAHPCCVQPAIFAEALPPSQPAKPVEILSVPVPRLPRGQSELIEETCSGIGALDVARPESDSKPCLLWAISPHSIPASPEGLFARSLLRSPPLA
jgi:hypothetical protein